MYITKRAVFDRDKCLFCKPCPAMEDCPPGALQEEDDFLFVGIECQGCGKCLKTCPYQALNLD